MIVRIYQGQTELRVNLVEPGKYGRKLASKEGVRLVVVPAERPPHVNVSKIIRTGRWGWPLPAGEYPSDPTALPALVYPCFDVAPEGELIFRLDKQMFERPCGRYIGKVWVGHHEAARLDLDLVPMNFKLRSVERLEPEVCR
jgi:hypothetical protein